jgi:hypothetical protein
MAIAFLKISRESRSWFRADQLGGALNLEIARLQIASAVRPPATI